MANLEPAHWMSDQTVTLWEETLGTMMDRVAAAHPHRPALVFEAPGRTEQRWTYRELVDDSVRVAQALLNQFSPGDHIAVWSPNCAEWVLLQHGAARAGIRLVTINPAFVAREAAYVLEQSRAVGLFHATTHRDTDLTTVVADLATDLPRLRATLSWSDWPEFLSSGDLSRQLPETRPGDGAMIQYTSGTTGQPKGVLLSHRGMINSAQLVAERAELEDCVVTINSMPLFHIGGCGTMELGTFSRAGTYVLVPQFDPGHVLELVEKHRGTAVLAVPTMLIALVEHPERESRDLSSLRTILTGGASAPADLVRRVKNTFGCRFSITFGQTETSGPAVQTSVHDSERDQAETIGRPLPSMEARIVDVVTGEPVAFGEQGEIHMRGPLVMMEYLDRPEETAQAVDQEAWLHFGDLGAMDRRGFLRITGRSRDMITRGGENIYPREIEDVLFEHEAVSDVAVIGLPDARWGEIIAAAARLKPAAGGTTEDDLRAHCQERLARFKIPSRWFFVSEFPQTASGKIQKFRLRDQLASAPPSDGPASRAPGA